MPSFNQTPQTICPSGSWAGSSGVTLLKGPGTPGALHVQPPLTDTQLTDGLCCISQTHFTQDQPLGKCLTAQAFFFFLAVYFFLFMRLERAAKSELIHKDSGSGAWRFKITSFLVKLLWIAILLHCSLAV